MSLVIGGKKLPDTSRVIDWTDSGLHFPLTYSGVRKRTVKVKKTVSHWTGGEATVKSAADDGAVVYNVLKNRTDPRTGRPMPLSIHFTIGYDGTIWQYCDLVDTVCFHAGAVNSDSVGWEIVCPGDGKTDPRRPRKFGAETIHGRRVRFAMFTDAQVESAVWLAEAVHDALGIRRTLPSAEGRPDFLENTRIPQGRLERFEGHLEHLHCSSTKRDGGLQVSRALLGRGFNLQPH